MAYFVFLSWMCLLTVYVSALLFAELCFERMLSSSKLELKFAFCFYLGKHCYTEYLAEELGFDFQPLDFIGNSVLILSKDGSLQGAILQHDMLGKCFGS